MVEDMNRENWILALLFADNQSPIKGSIKLMKEMFLINQEVDTGYKFRAWDLGPVCFEIYEDIDKLVSNWLINKEVSSNRK